MARAAVLGRLTWQVGTVAEIREETATARTIVIDVPGLELTVQRLEDALCGRGMMPA